MPILFSAKMIETFVAQFCLLKINSTWYTFWHPIVTFVSAKIKIKYLHNISIIQLTIDNETCALLTLTPIEVISAITTGWTRKLQKQNWFTQMTTLLTTVTSVFFFLSSRGNFARFLKPSTKKTIFGKDFFHFIFSFPLVDTDRTTDSIKAAVGFITSLMNSYIGHGNRKAEE